MDENIDAARHDKKSRGTEIAFFADHLTFLIAMQDRGAFRPIIELRTRHFFERGQILDELIDTQRFTPREFFNDFLHVGSFRATAQGIPGTCSLLKKELSPWRDRSAHRRQPFGMVCLRNYR